MSTASLRATLPYRPCVGVMVLNAKDQVFVGHRIGFQEHFGDEHVWQMPQGGIDKGEEPWDAAKRELFEETNISSFDLISEVSDWLRYDLPDDSMGIALKGRFRGQTQKWFIVRFTGDESEIDVDQPGGGAHPAEFKAWRWIDVDALPGLIVPFKRAVYEGVVEAWRKLPKS